MITELDAMKAVAQMELMTYFNGLSEGARSLIAEELMAMCNWPREKVVRNGYGIVPYVEPIDRLKWLMLQLKKVSAWPGMSEVRGIYCLRFTPADGIVAECDREALGVTDDGVLIGNDLDARAIAAPEREQEYLPGPDDEPIDDLKDDIAALAKKMAGKK